MKTYKRVFWNNTKSLANKTINFVNESHLLIWGNLQLGLTWQRHKNCLYMSPIHHVKLRVMENKVLDFTQWFPTTASGPQLLPKCCVFRPAKSYFSIRKSILTSKQQAEHPFAGRNTQHPSIHQVFRKFVFTNSIINLDYFPKIDNFYSIIFAGGQLTLKYCGTLS